MKPPGTNAGSGSISRLGGRFADRRPKIPCLGSFHASTLQNSNRERIRLETAVTQTKQRIGTCSNREKEALSFGPSRGGCFGPPAVRPRFSHRQPPAKTHIHRAATDRNSNREGIRLETAATQTKQRIGTCSIREKEACFFDVELASRPKAFPSGLRQHPQPRREGGAPPPLRTATSTAGQKSKSPPPKSVAIETEADRLFWWSYGEF
jgi:hypothetical protein